MRRSLLNSRSWRSGLWNAPWRFCGNRAEPPGSPGGLQYSERPTPKGFTQSRQNTDMVMPLRTGLLKRWWRQPSSRALCAMALSASTITIPRNSMRTTLWSGMALRIYHGAIWRSVICATFSMTALMTVTAFRSIRSGSCATWNGTKFTRRCLRMMTPRLCVMLGIPPGRRFEKRSRPSLQSSLIASVKLMVSSRAWNWKKTGCRSCQT
mmetsp:Transcript_76163/g.150612  ORF Transcript_76163/g.150612 Transcript_76163/m.150612 type:complete len:209 (-) Transcript_76163:498-1124(-)